MKTPSKKTVYALIVFGLLKKVFLILWIFYVYGVSILNF